MATLLSPGELVEIIDQSPAGIGIEGTVPLIIIATAANKTASDGSGVASYTTAAATNRYFVADSQRSLLLNYGNPIFQTLDGSPLHGSELNEYGLSAAYQFLGLYNQAMILRADIDLAQLKPSPSAPTGAAKAGTYWFDTYDTKWGLFHCNGNSLPGAAWESQTVLVCNATNATVVNGIYVPAPTFGTDGAYAVVTVTEDNKFYQKVSGVWYEIGTTAWRTSLPTVIYGTANPSNLSTGMAFTLNGTTITVTANGALSDVQALINNAAISNIHASITNNALTITNVAGGPISIANSGNTAPLTILGITAGTTPGVTVDRTSDAQYPSGRVLGSIWIKGTSSNKGAKWVVKYFSTATNGFITLNAPFYPYDSTKNDGDPVKDLYAISALGYPAAGNLYVGYDAAKGVQVIRRWSGTLWEDLVYEATQSTPTTPPAAGTLWYNSNLSVDIMVGDGQKWLGYRRRYPSTDPLGVIIAGSAPALQTDGSPLVDNDLWLDGSDLENYPALYRYSEDSLAWARLNLTDQSSPFGILFQDVRADSGPAFTGIANPGLYQYNSTRIQDMLASDYLDPDAPDPREHPDGMLLFNMRYSSYNIKQWVPNYFINGNFDANTNYTQQPYEVGGFSYIFPPVAASGRWVNASPLKADGSPNMGRHAQRVMVTEAMKAVVTANQDIRAEGIVYDLIAAPGYPELMSDLISLNTDMGDISFVIGDTPARLVPQATNLQNWATNTAVAPDNGDLGLVSADNNAAIYYPWGLSTNVDGKEIMIPPSAIALCVYAYSDSVSYEWYAPAGLNRGKVTTATSVGYLTSEGEFKPTFLNQGLRDVLYTNNINPIHYAKGTGLFIDGQKTLCPTPTSALSRVNVVRLTCYLRINLKRITQPFLFEPNVQQTRDAATLVVSSFLTSLVVAKAIEDYAVVCDSSNNTGTRIDANELWIDIAIHPVRAIEFIYIPVRIQSDSQALNATQGSTTIAALT